VAIKTGGVWGQRAETLLRRRIDIAIQRGNAMSVSSTFPIACSIGKRPLGIVVPTTSNSME